MYRSLVSVLPAIIMDIKCGIRRFKPSVPADSPAVVQCAMLQIGILPIPLGSEHLQLMHHQVKGATTPPAHPIEFLLILGYANFVTSAWPMA